MTEREKFMAQLAEARDAGLVDLKFCFRPTKPMKAEEIFGALNEVEAAVEAGHSHTQWAGNVPA